VKQASKGDNGLCVYSLHVPTRGTNFFDVKGGNGLMFERTHVSPHAILSKINLFSKKIKNYVFFTFTKYFLVIVLFNIISFKKLTTF
jgi:hypothetical protein